MSEELGRLNATWRGGSHLAEIKREWNRGFLRDCSLSYVYLQSLILCYLCHYCIVPRLKTHMRYAAQLPMIFRLCQSRGNRTAFSVYTHDLMSVARRGSVITSLGSYSYRIGARLARRVFKIGTLVMEWCTVGWMCACERASDPPPRLRPRSRRQPSEWRAFTQSVGSERGRRSRRMRGFFLWRPIDARTRIVNCFFITSWNSYEFSAPQAVLELLIRIQVPILS